MVPQKPVIYITTPERAINYQWEEEAQKLSPNLEIMSIDDIGNLPMEVKKKIFSSPMIEEGTIWVLDPFEDRYYPADKAKDVIPRSKFRAIEKIAGLLGAKSIHHVSSKTQVSKREMSASGDIKIKVFNANAQYSADFSFKFAQEETLDKEFKGNKTIEGYKKALEFCQTTGLIYDPEIKRMLEDCDPKHPNPIISQKYTVSLTSECEEQMDTAFSLNFMGNLFSISGKYTEAISNKYEEVLTYEIIYGENKTN